MHFFYANFKISKLMHHLLVQFLSLYLEYA